MRIIIECPESDSPLRGRIHLRGLTFVKLQSSCSSAADHTLSEGPVGSSLAFTPPQTNRPEDALRGWTRTLRLTAPVCCRVRTIF